ncbi:MAG: glycosyltransferase family 4 protein [Gammaproteobacteria bacterium]|nr:glycosyltransferase family 4 protein [Gammaproteobacteria bacterium]
MSGWVMPDNDLRVESLSLYLRYKSDSSPVIIPISYSSKRENIALLYPARTGAEFYVFSLLSGSLQIRDILSAELHWGLSNGQTITADLSSMIFRNKFHWWLTTFHNYKKLLYKAVKLLRNAEVSVFISKIKKYMSKPARKYPVASIQRVQSAVKGKAIALIVDHDLGGGANLYRKEYVANKLAVGQAVIVVGFDIIKLQYFLDVFREKKRLRYGIDSIEDVLSFIHSADVTSMLYNCAVSFPEPILCFEFLINLKKQQNCEFIVALHDYFLICPSPFLINSEGSYCGIPDPKVCASCLAHHNDDFVRMLAVNNITDWREQCAYLLKAADQVALFSEASKRLLKKAHPKLSDENWKVIPHVLHTIMHKVSLKAANHLHIGVVGSIGKHKGADVVNELAHEILRVGSEAKITVIGMLDAIAPVNIVTVTGNYKPADLPDLIANSGIDIFLFPSICAETFSYVCHELVAMDVPIACFDLGAPADLVRDYAKGQILKSTAPDDILKNLAEFKNRIYKL